MITPAALQTYTAKELKEYTVKDLTQVAKKLSISGLHEMRKDDLVRALVRAARARARAAEGASKSRSKKSSAAKAGGARSGGSKSAGGRSAGGKSAGGRSAKSAGLKAASPKAARGKKAKVDASTVISASKSASKPKGKGKAAVGRASAVGRSAKSSRNGHGAPAISARVNGAKLDGHGNGKPPAESAIKGGAESRSKAKSKRPAKPPIPSNPKVAAKLARASKVREQQRDLSAQRNGAVGKGDRDRIVLLVRDPFWLHACWEVSRQSIARARAAMAEHWHTARPMLRLYEVEMGSTTSSAERPIREIPIHGAVSNWYIDVDLPPRGFRVEIGYQADNGKFFTIARSNSVTTPRPGSSDDLDENWNAVAEDYEKIYAMSGGTAEGCGELKELFEERLRRPMGSPLVTQFGVGAERALNRQRDFRFEVDAEMIIYGQSKPDAHVSLSGEPVKLRPDGTFTVRLAMPDRRQVLPVVASSPDGVEQRTIVLAIERNTKVMEPYINDETE